MDLKELLASYLEIYDGYHGTKENLGYGVTTAYVLAASTLMMMEHPFWVGYSTLVFCLFVLLLAMTSALAFTYVNWQFDLRSRAGIMFAACNNLAVRLLNRQLTPQEMEASPRTPLFPDHVLPEALVEEYESLIPAGWRIGRHRFFSFLVMTLWAVAAFSYVVSVWLHPPPVIPR
jgi:hypothetical protein